MAERTAAVAPAPAAEPGRPALVHTPAFDALADACAWLAAAKPSLRATLDEYGACMLRGLPVRSPSDFAAVRDALVDGRAAYQEKATPRSRFGDDVFSSTDLPPAHRIRLHNENSYTLTFPGTLIFGCLTAPAEGGATPVADVRKVLARLPGDLADRFRAVGWRLTRNFGEHLGLDWRTSFAAETRQDVERYCAENLIACEWRDGDRLRTTQVRSAIVRHPRTGDEIWFNHVAFWNEWSLDPDIRAVLGDELGPGELPFDTGFGDGERLTEQEIAVLNAAYDDETVRERWRAGDVMIVDNLLAAHGRDPFRGDRRIVVAMGDPVALGDCSPTVAAFAP
ncbi:TauD/TfdA family dioxygenase [Streptosporangiaceae bacterium NEAU-GS5]|nr:TauD/TfdA family dioxygenase [Streptosporangiaceae bacterium NEAU-GS5]